MKIVGHIGDRTFLLDVGHDQGQILDLDRKQLWPPTAMGSLVNHGGPWDPYTGPQGRLQALLAQVKQGPPPRPVQRQQTPEERAKLLKELAAQVEAEKKKKAP